MISFAINCARRLSAFTVIVIILCSGSIALAQVAIDDFDSHQWQYAFGFAAASGTPVPLTTQRFDEGKQAMAFALQLSGDSGFAGIWTETLPNAQALQIASASLDVYIEADPGYTKVPGVKLEVAKAAGGIDGGENDTPPLNAWTTISYSPGSTVSVSQLKVIIIDSPGGGSNTGVFRFWVDNFRINSQLYDGFERHTRDGVITTPYQTDNSSGFSTHGGTFLTPAGPSPDRGTFCYRLNWTSDADQVVGIEDTFTTTVDLGFATTTSLRVYVPGGSALPAGYTTTGVDSSNNVSNPISSISSVTANDIWTTVSFNSMSLGGNGFDRSHVRQLRVRATGAGASGTLYLDTIQYEAILTDEISYSSFMYFWNQAKPSTGLVPDKLSASDICSIAATGFGLAALPVGVERGYITHAQGEARALLTLQTLQNTPAQRYGLWSHYLDANTGEPATGGWETAASTIDSALCVAGALTAGHYFGGQCDIIANQLFSAMDWKAFADPAQGNRVRMVWTPDIPGNMAGTGTFSAQTWDWYTDETLLISLLGISAPDSSKRLAASAMSNWNRPIGTYNGHTYIYSFPGSLYTYTFAQCYYDFRRTGSDINTIDWWTNTAAATAANRDWCRNHSGTYPTYSMNRWGMSACTVPSGYGVPGHQPRGAAGDDPEGGTLAPYGAAMAMPWLPGDSLAALAEMRNFTVGGTSIWRSVATGGYGFLDAFNVTANWVSDDVLGIDQGPMLLCIENSRTGLVWNQFMSQQVIRDGLIRAGFSTTGTASSVDGDWTLFQ